MTIIKHVDHAPSFSYRIFLAACLVLLVGLLLFVGTARKAHADEVNPACLHPITYTLGGWTVPVHYPEAVNPRLREQQISYLDQMAGHYDKQSPIWRSLKARAMAMKLWGFTHKTVLPCLGSAENAISSPIQPNPPPSTPVPPTEPPSPPTEPPPPEDQGQRGRDYDPQPNHGSDNDHAHNGH